MLQMVPQTKCPIDIAIQILSNKWTVAIVRELLHGPRRPSDLERHLKGISAKTLSERLHDLQGWGLVIRQSYPEVPPRVEYSLSELGKQLDGPMIALKQFGQLWQRTTGSETYAGSFCELCPDGSDLVCPSTHDLSSKNVAERKAQSAPNQSSI